VFDCACGEILAAGSCSRVGDSNRLSCAACGRTYRVSMLGLGSWRVTEAAA
jgi:hypothetical protein